MSITLLDWDKICQLLLFPRFLWVKGDRKCASGDHDRIRKDEYLVENRVGWWWGGYDFCYNVLHL